MGPRPLPMIGNLLPFRRNPLAFLSRAAREYGDIVLFSFGKQQVFFLNHPDLCRQVLVVDHRNFARSPGMQRAKGLLGDGLLASCGEFHHRQRRMAQPAFHRQRLKGYGDVMIDYGIRISDQWKNGTTVDMAEEMMRLTLSIVAKTLFDTEVESVAEEIGEALTVSMEHFFTIRLPFTAFFERMTSPFIPSKAEQFRRARERLDSILYQIIAERREEGRDRGDLLSMLLVARDVEGDGTGMSDVQIRDEIMNMIIAGHETTAVALTWTFYLLSQYPEVECRLHEELREVLQGRCPHVDDLTNLRYTEMVFAESMRLYPPVWVIARQALDPYTIHGVDVPKNGTVLMSPYVMHRDSRFFDDPNVFTPERWASDHREMRSKPSYFPFGGGVHQCIGEGFAWMEGILLIATIAQRWRMRIRSGHRVTPAPLVTLRAKGGMPMVLERRRS